MSSHYAGIIAAAISTTDPATVALVEELMRFEHPTLDHLSRARLVRLARTAHNDALVWATPEGAAEMNISLAEWCDSMGVTVPDFARTLEPAGTLW